MIQPRQNQPFDGNVLRLERRGHLFRLGDQMGKVVLAMGDQEGRAIRDAKNRAGLDFGCILPQEPRTSLEA